MTNYTARRFREKMRQALDEADEGKPVVIERYDIKWGDMKKRPKKLYNVVREPNKDPRPDIDKDTREQL